MTRPGAVVVVSVVALIFAGLASWGVYNYLQQETEKNKGTQGENIVVAAAEIPVGMKVNATHLKIVGWPKGSKPEGSFSDINSVLGRTAIRQITTSEAVTEQKLMPKEGTPGAGVMTYLVPQGHRAVTVGVNEVAGVAGFLNPNNKVDVVLTTQIPGSKTGESISKIVLQNVPILATGQITTEQKDGKPVVVPTVTLDLTPDDSEKLINAASKGSLQMLLRNVLDTATAEAKGATIIKVLGGVERPAVKTVTVRKTVVKTARPVQGKVPPPSPSYYNVEIIKGPNKSTRQFAPEAGQ